jgi:uncharacterized protein (TIGR03086 family)
MLTNDVVELDRRAVRASVAVVTKATIDDLDRPTPCAEWTLADLLAHMTAQHIGFAAAAAGAGLDLAAWQPAVGDDPLAAYPAAAQRVLDAFAEAGVPDREFSLPELSSTTTFPGARAIGFHLVDYVAHGWDVARTIGVRLELDDETLDAALTVAQAVPTGPARLRPGAAFAPVVGSAGDGSVLDRIVALLGRSPTWPDP